MKRKHLRFGKGFRVALGNKRSQAAEMVLPPGDAEGDRKNRHHGADQWLFVVSGSGTATINGKRYPMKSGTLLLIERDDKHEILNTGRGMLRTLNFYVPPLIPRQEWRPFACGAARWRLKQSGAAHIRNVVWSKYNKKATARWPFNLGGGEDNLANGEWRLGSALLSLKTCT